MSRPTVLVLAGGISQRAWPLREKLLLNFGGQSLFLRHMRLLRSLGCENLVVVANPQNEASLRQALSSADIESEFVIQPEPRGMADAVLQAAGALVSSPDAGVYVTQAHDVVGPDLHTAMLDAHARSDCFGLIAAQAVNSYFPGGYLQLEDERIVSIIEKPVPGEEPSNLVNLVAHVFGSAQDLLRAVEEETASGESTADNAYERALTRLLAKVEVRPYVYTGRWQALKYPWDVLSVMEMLLERWSGGLESPGQEFEETEAGVFLGRDVTIHPGAHVVAPAVIGSGSVIGHNALVRGSVVGSGCVVGFGSEVARSYLADGVELHHNYVGDSVLDREAALGFGATTANFRVDGRSVPSEVSGRRIDTGRMKLGLVAGAGVKIGVNTSTMPGTKVGAGAIIGPNLRVTRDVPDGKRLYDERGYGRF